MPLSRPGENALSINVRLDICRTAAAITTERARAGVVGEGVGVAHRSAHRPGQLELVDLVLHVGHAVAGDGVEDLLRLLGHSLLDCSGFGLGVPPNRLLAIVDRLPQMLHRCIEFITCHVLPHPVWLVFDRLKCKSTDGRKTGAIRAFNIHDVVICVERGRDGIGRHLVCLGPVKARGTDQLHSLLHSRLHLGALLKHHAFSNPPSTAGAV